MTTHPVFGHHATRQELGSSFVRGHLPQVLLFSGEPGVGKQRLALWLAQLVLCERHGPAPCGACRACRLVDNLSHSDLHWFVPVPRPKASDPDKQVEEVKEALGEVMTARRESAIYDRPDGLAMHGVASARLLLRSGALTTVEGGRRVFIIGDAERLVPQEANQEAATALLKFLEEPPTNAVVVLTAPDPTRVLPTIRSRAAPVRLGRLAIEEIEQALVSLMPKLSPAERRSRAESADGSLGRALFARDESASRDAAGQLLQALKQGGVARFERALGQAPWQARGEFAVLLDRLADALGDAARAAAGAAPRARVAEALAGITDPARLVGGLDQIELARELARGNVNPQLLLANLTRDLAETLWH